MAKLPHNVHSNTIPPSVGSNRSMETKQNTRQSRPYIHSQHSRFVLLYDPPQPLICNVCHRRTTQTHFSSVIVRTLNAEVRSILFEIQMSSNLNTIVCIGSTNTCAFDVITMTECTHATLYCSETPFVAGLLNGFF